ncbi:SGNH/GDSL hydrolase family protein [Nocardioides sp. WS12]|uniref:SGNH/GDSL hydrolase family protein n=1 Tax=Nocardioides sp. WS12 TaxID=2486272 RepID=UPI0015FE78D4|nr:SGNH/GDSL hydrolase family protein [Nocardioides sp. WS12]
MRHRIRVFKAKTLAWLGFIGFIVAVARRRVDQVWVGDSNAVMMVTSSFPPLGVGRGDDGRWVWHLGPRLMYSISRDGFKPGMRRALRILRLVPGHDRVNWFFSFGEIDLRCHLAPRVKEKPELPFIPTYIERVRSLVSEFGASHAFIVVPVPPAVDIFVDEGFPIEGTLEDRLAAHRLMRSDLLAVTQAEQSRPRIEALDLTDALSDANGYYSPEFTSDGVHPTDAGRAAARQVVELQLQSA